MSKIYEEMATRCELALMGKVVPVNNNDEVQVMTEYMMSAMGKDTSHLVNIMENAINHYCKNNVKYVVCNTVQGMPCITYLLECASDDEEEQYPAPFETDYGTGYPCAFSYVFNLESDWCSEFGDTFYHKDKDGFYHRKG